MSPVTSSRLLAGAILVLVLGDPTDACSCAPQHPQTAFCQADVVIRGRFMGITPLSHNSSRGESVPWVRYEIKTTKIYKGFEPLTDVHFVDTPALESVCGYQHPAPLKGEEYLIMATQQDERLTVSACSFVRPWGRVPPSQRRGVSQAYEGGCACQVLPCLFMPCSLSGDAQCLWTDGLLDRSWQGPQAQRLACLPRPSQGAPPGADPFCTWEPLKSRLPGALLKAGRGQ
ncbi:metalloproteinase inhibitor 1 isoform X1 [Gopherus flavomarginatus]|uniref:metalloproteinase inhibitor 1 isoform X1 n=1 Tax=Gopherus flavomarginatus TaxID=286002 RepID=UPI0021CC1978|nr:metalloproteinase inhibitor 1 isoform X1 [Gopherus flavomarginatus]